MGVDFFVTQGGFSFPAIQNGVIDDLNADVVTKDCIGVAGLCRVSMQPVAAFFAVPAALTVSGSVRVGDAKSRNQRLRYVEYVEKDLNSRCDTLSLFIFFVT